MDPEAGGGETPVDVVDVLFVIFDHDVFDATAEVLRAQRRQRPVGAEFV